MTAPPATLHPDAARAALSATLRGIHGPDARLEDWAAHPVTKRGKQRAVRYDVHARVAGGALVRHYQWVGKFYDGDDEPRTVATILRALASSDCATRGGVVIPAFVDYYAPQRLLLLGYEPGESMVAATARQPGVVLGALGRALAALHATPVPLETVTSAAAVLADVGAKVAELRVRLPCETVDLPRRLLELTREAPTGPVMASFLHGDCGPAQLLWQEGNIVVLDFDRCTRGDPALDLGNLLTQLRRLTLRKPGKLPDFAAVRAEILDGYRRWSVRDHGLDGRVGWYELATLLRKIHSLVFDTTRHPEPGAREQRRAEALRLLAWVQ